MELYIPYLWVFLFAFFLNLLWEIVHSRLYTTCQRMELNAYVRLIIDMSFRDALWITLSYVGSVLIFESTDIFGNILHLSTLLLWLLLFSWIVEYVALRTKRWEYTSSMPRILGVGLTPFVELAVTALGALLLSASYLA